MLDVFPSKYWRYADERGTVFGQWLEVGTEKGQWTARLTPKLNKEPMVYWHGTTSEGETIQSLALFVMESQWFRPEIGLGREEKVRGITFDVVSVSVGRFHADYYFDKRTHYLTRVVATSNVAYTILGARSVDLTDYELVSGVQMPTSYRAEGRPKYSIKTLINADYDPLIFERRPNIEDAPDGWRRRNDSTLPAR